MAKIAVTTDTHYGFDKSTRKIHEKFWAKLGKEIVEQSVDVLVISGDIISHKQEQWDKLLALVRTHIHIPIVIVRGNHDFWDHEGRHNRYCSRYKKVGWIELNQEHKAVFEKYKIHHLEGNPFVVGDVIILGFDGWYHEINPPTNDMEQMIPYINSTPTHLFLSHKAHQDFEAVLSHDIEPYRAAVCVTHFPPFSDDPRYQVFCANPRYYSFMTEKFDVLIVGHSHKQHDFVEDGCRVINAGSHYNKPRHVIFEI